MNNELQEQAVRVRLLGVNPDTLVVNVLPVDMTGEIVKRPLLDSLQAELDQWKELAQNEDEPVPTRWVFEGSNLFMLDKAGAPFKWILEHPKIKVAISRGVRLPLLGEVRFSSEYLWAYKHDLSKAVSDVWLFLTQIFGDNITLQPSAVDLAVDFTGWDVGSSPLEVLRSRFISRATSDDAIPGGFNEDGMIDGPDRIKRRWRRTTGLPFGLHTSPVSCLLYDKTHEIRYHSKEKTWFYDLWSVEKDEDGRPVQPVWRLELRFRRKALHEGEIETVWQLLERVPELWAYGVGHVGGDTDGLPDGWLRYVMPTPDTNRSRWPVHPVWQVLQSAFSPDGPAAPDAPAGSPTPGAPAPASAVADAPVPDLAASALAPVVNVSRFQRRRKREVNMERGIAAISGWAGTIEAWRQNFACEHPLGQSSDVETDLSDTFHFLYREVQAYQEKMEQKKKKKSFSEQVYKKRGVYHLAPVASV